MRVIAEEVGQPYETIISWIHGGSHKSFSQNYARAKKLQAFHLAEEIIEIADDSSKDTISNEFGDKEDKEWTNRSRLRIDVRKWYAGKLAPKIFGDKLEVEQVGKTRIIISKTKPIQTEPDAE